MENLRIVFGLIGVLFIAIIGVYVWTFKVYKDMKLSLGNVYERMNSDFVREKVCNTMHEALKENVLEIKADVKLLLTK